MASSDTPMTQRSSLCSTGSATPGSMRRNSSKPTRRSIQRGRSAPSEPDGASESPPPEIRTLAGPESRTPVEHEGVTSSGSADDRVQASVSQLASFASAEQVHVAIGAEHLSDL